ncbi:MAG: S-methyl-5-thioribose-1-phosphate isomerase [Deltaproteobacteria bacterium]|nr:MAG: S-methyl-5-thioribose-1-phosphate isomerase [Deltaproteobacteria bacterium]
MDVESTRRHIVWEGDALHLLDQRRLPAEEVVVTCRSAADAAAAIRDMVVRGAPAIGVTAAYGLALEARRVLHEAEGEARLRAAAASLREARPTAVNLMWAVDRMLGVLRAARGAPDLTERLRREAEAIDSEDLEMCRAIGKHGAPLLPDAGNVLTHCNAGALATAGYGTALGVVRAAIEMGKRVAVLADETRPYLQGARLTAYELHADGIPVTILPDVAAGHLMARGEVAAVVVGADRIAANGDTANKIGTYTVAVLAARHQIPFYVAAPTSTIDLSTERGAQIPIEERPAEEVTHLAGVRLAPPGVGARNPAFDVTPAELVSAIVTERGVARAPYGETLARLCGAS